MTKGWNKTNEGNYSFSVANKEIGNMEISYASLDRKAICHIEDNDFIIKRTGFWKSTIEISNLAGQTIAKIYPEKWYANTWTFDYNEKKYKVIVRNNPLAEYAILDNSNELAAYGLTTDNGKINVRITTPSNNSDFLFDFLLWYLFVPIATENMGDNFIFLMLLNNQ
jgi:hypothetical protein